LFLFPSGLQLSVGIFYSADLSPLPASILLPTLFPPQSSGDFRVCVFFCSSCAGRSAVSAASVPCFCSRESAVPIVRSPARVPDLSCAGCFLCAPCSSLFPIPTTSTVAHVQVSDPARSALLFVSCLQGELASSSRFPFSLDAKCFPLLLVCVVENLVSVLCCLAACTHVFFLWFFCCSSQITRARESRLD
jgi:hypothetical protein